MYLLARKNNLCRNLMKMRKFSQSDYNFFPLTWSLPIDYAELKNEFKADKN